jgi:MurNAc alpha-1-phosphate uridylyltransferase
MKAIILAAGRGERMRPLTDTTPKPLLEVHGRPLIEWHLRSLARGGVHEVIVNTAWREQQIVDALGDGARFGLAITYSREGRDHGGALETAGGLKKALPLLADPSAAADGAFWYVAGDVYAPAFGFDDETAAPFLQSTQLARLWMVPNPPQHPGGDFGIEGGLATVGAAGARCTWSGIGLFRTTFVTELMRALAVGAKARLRPYLDTAIAQQRLGAVLYDGLWADVGTPERLHELNAMAPPGARVVP